MDNYVRPVSVVFYPRCGSSLVTGIFVKHGFWFGTDRKREEAERHYKTKNYVKGLYENKGIKNILRSMKTGNAGWRLYDAKIMNKLRFMIHEQGYKPKQKWVAKIAFKDYFVWRKHFPEGIYIYVRRNHKAIQKSNKNVRFKRHKKSIELYKYLENHMARPRFIIDFERLIGRDYAQLEWVAAYLNLKLDYDILNTFIKPELKHF